MNHRLKKTNRRAAEIAEEAQRMIVRSQPAVAATPQWEKPETAHTKMAPILTASSVLTATADFHHFGFFSFLAIFTTVLAVLLGRTITGPMRAFCTWFVSHDNNLLFGVVIVGLSQFWG